MASHIFNASWLCFLFFFFPFLSRTGNVNVKYETYQTINKADAFPWQTSRIVDEKRNETKKNKTT